MSFFIPLMMPLLKWTVLVAVVMALLPRSRNTSASTLHSIVLLTLGALFVFPIVSWGMPKVTIAMAGGPLTEFVIDGWKDDLRQLSWSPYGLMVVSIYAAGAILMLVKIVSENVRLWFLDKSLSQCDDFEVIELVEQLRQELRITRRIAVKTHRREHSPFTYGVLVPRIVVPLAYDWERPQLRRVLIHELAHIRRNDWLWQQATNVLCALCWWHPGVWVLKRKLGWFSEVACDDVVVLHENDRVAYGQDLLCFSRLMSEVPRAVVSWIDSSIYFQRVAHVIDGTRIRRHQPFKFGVSMGAVLVITCASSFFRLTYLSASPVSQPTRIMIPGHANVSPSMDCLDCFIGPPRPIDEDHSFPILSASHELPYTPEYEPMVDLAVNLDTPAMVFTGVDPMPELILQARQLPKYPRRAILKSLEADIFVEFDVGRSGGVHNIRIPQQSNKIFHKAVIDSLRSAKYRPVVINGEAVEVKDVSEVFTFKLQDVSE